MTSNDSTTGHCWHRVTNTTRKLIKTVAISNDLMRMQPGRADTFVLNSMMRGMRTKLDSMFLRGVVSNEPISMYWNAAEKMTIEQFIVAAQHAANTCRHFPPPPAGT